MNMKKLNVALAILVAVVSSGNAEPVYSDVVGYMKISIPAGKASLVSFPLGGAPLTSGVFSGKSGNVLSTSAALNSLPGTLLNSSSEAIYYAEITSVINQGRILEIVGKSSASIIVGDSSGISGNETFVLKKFTTIADVFGAQNSAGLKGGDGVGNADVVWSVVSGAWKQYFFYDDGNGGEVDPLQWQTIGSFDDKSDTRIDPEQGVLIARLPGINKDVTIVGTVKSTSTIAPMITGAQIITNPYPIDKTLGSLGLYTGDVATGLKSGDQVTTADVVYKLVDGVWKQYFVYDDGNAGEVDPIQWQTPGNFADQQNISVAAGEALLLIRRGQQFEWKPAKPTL